MRNKGLGVIATILIVALLVGGITLGGIYVSQKSVFGPTPEEKAANSFGRYTAKFNGIAIAGDAQDSADDLDYDVFEWDPEANSDLKSKGWLDCSMATPAKFNGKDVDIEIEQDNFCDINPYVFWQDSDFNAGNAEDKLDDYLIKVEADVADAQASSAGDVELTAGKTYLVVLTEGATTDNEDVIPLAFLITSDTTTTSDEMVKSLQDGTLKPKFIVRYYSDAADSAHNKIRLSGTWEDDEDNSGTLDSSLDGAIDSSLTTATTIKWDGTVELEITKDGYGIVLKNPLATSNLQKPYLVITPYGENVTNGSWVEYGTTGLTGDVPYNSGDTTAAQIIWQGMTACGATITDDSSTDAVKMGDEKLYDNVCFENAVERRNGVYGIFDDGGKLEIDIHINEVKVDYDSSATADNEIVDGGSGSSPEDFCDIDLVGVHDTSDFLGQTLSG